MSNVWLDAAVRGHYYRCMVAVNHISRGRMVSKRSLDEEKTVKRYFPSYKKNYIKFGRVK